MHHNQVGFIPDSQGWFNICKSFNVIHHINQRNVKYLMIISINAEKTFNKVQHPFTIKTLTKVSIEGTCLNIIQDFSKRVTSRLLGQEKPNQIIYNAEK